MSHSSDVGLPQEELYQPLPFTFTNTKKSMGLAKISTGWTLPNAGPKNQWTWPKNQRAWPGLKNKQAGPCRAEKSKGLGKISMGLDIQGQNINWPGNVSLKNQRVRKNTALK